MRIHTSFYAAAILLAATLSACGDTAAWKFPCRAGEVLTSLGVCADPDDLVAREKHCARGMLEASDGTCVPPADPETPWVFPCGDEDLLHEDGSCTPAWKFPCAAGNVLQSDGTCTAVGGDELSRIAATSRVYVTLAGTERVEYAPATDGSWAETSGFVFHAVGEDFVVTKVALGLGSLGLQGDWASWITASHVYYTDEGNVAYHASADGAVNADAQIPIRMFVPKGGTSQLNTGLSGDMNVCRNAHGFNGWATSLVVSRTEAYGLTTGKRIILSETAFDVLAGNRYILCGTEPDPRDTP